jgi:hypothetical protein
MDGLIGNILTLAITICGSQMFAFFIDFLKWAVRKKHPARIEKSEDVRYPQNITVFVWSDSRHYHGYVRHDYIRKEGNTYKEKYDHSVGRWIRIILIDLFYILVSFAVPIVMLFYVPDYPYIGNFFGISAAIFLMFLHAELTGSDTIARIELYKYFNNGSINR